MIAAATPCSSRLFGSTGHGGAVFINKLRRRGLPIHAARACTKYIVDVRCQVQPLRAINSELFFMPAKGAQMDVRNEKLPKDAVFVFFADIVLFKRIAVTLCIVTLLVAFLVPPTYDIGGRILVESKQISLSPDSLGAPTGFSQVLPSTPQDVETEVSLILSPSFSNLPPSACANSTFFRLHSSACCHGCKGPLVRVMDYAKQGITFADRVHLSPAGRSAVERPHELC